MAYEHRLKFGPKQSVKFVKLYRSYECLWNTNDVNNKNRYARNKALQEFVQKLNIPGFGLRDLTTKIKNIRSQYLQEKKKIKASFENDAEVYESKLPWFAVMDSFLANTCENRTTVSSVSDDEITDSQDTYEDEVKPKIEECDTIFVDSRDNIDITSKKDRSIKLVKNATSLHTSKKRKKKHGGDDELVAFGNYIVSNLRLLNQEYCIHAQDEIQAVLSKYKLKNIRDGGSLRQSFDSEEQSSAIEDSD